MAQPIPVSENEKRCFTGRLPGRLLGNHRQEKNEKGDLDLYYRGDYVRFCRYRPGEKCTLCGRRFSIRAGDEIKE